MNTTHDWAASVDHEHLEQIRGGTAVSVPHLALEVLAYPDDEAESLGRRGKCTVTLHPDGSIEITDDGRGTDTRVDEQGAVVKKPIMATKDLRFFDAVDGPLLPDGHPRRGMSVVAALSDWLVHTNHRTNGSWTQRYEYGVPVTDLEPVAADGTTGTTVHFLPSPSHAPNRFGAVNMPFWEGDAPQTGLGVAVGELGELDLAFAHLDITVVSLG
ncbi:hypothetical protein PWY87_19270 [Kribbella solani]|uniref:hypothetical protein n=1 Tax=Kribbella solani TaxID=236067 RepID=UPI0029BBC8E9|nr:hypothetical protein [Kribbella solani]MDX3003838.1 hypothetical protein [Kribbella solani]